MSNFLNNFSKDNYEKFNEEKLDDGELEKTEKNNEKLNDTELDSYVENTSQEPQIENTENKPRLVEKKSKTVEVISTSKILNEEEYVIDKNYYHRKNMKYYILSAIVVLLVILTLILYNNSTKVEMKDFIEESRETVEIWAQKYKIEVDYKEKYKKEIKKGLIYEQSIKPKTTIHKKDNITIFISKGGDPKEKIVVPDIMNQSEDQLNKWISDNYLDNVVIESVYDTTIPKGNVLSYSFSSSTVSETNYTRGDKLLIKTSKGIEPISKNIKVPEFKNKPLSEVLEWGVTNGVEIIVEEKDSKTIVKGMVISQSVKADKTVSKEDKLTVVISLGEGHVVLNFSNIAKKDVEKQAAVAKLTVQISEQYSNTVKYGTLMSQSVAVGDIAYAEDSINLIYSKGRPFINISGSEAELEKIIFDMNEECADLKINKIYVAASNEPKGIIIAATPNLQYVNVGDTINIIISSGGKIIVPDLKWRNIDDENTILLTEDLTKKGVKIIKEYVPSNNKNIIIGQSIAPWTEIATGDTVLILQIGN